MLTINLMNKHKCEYPKLNAQGKCIAKCWRNSGEIDCKGIRRYPMFLSEGMEIHITGRGGYVPMPFKSTHASRQALMQRYFDLDKDNDNDSTDCGI